MGWNQPRFVVSVPAGLCFARHRVLCFGATLFARRHRTNGHGKSRQKEKKIRQGQLWVDFQRPPFFRKHFQSFLKGRNYNRNVSEWPCGCRRQMAQQQHGWVRHTPFHPLFQKKKSHSLYQPCVLHELCIIFFISVALYSSELLSKRILIRKNTTGRE